MNFKTSVILELSKRLTALALAGVMLFNLSSQAMAQNYRPLNTGDAPKIEDLTAKRDNTYMATYNHMEQKLIDAKREASTPTILTYEEVRRQIEQVDTKKILTDEDFTAIYKLYRAEALKDIAEKQAIFAKYIKQDALATAKWALTQKPENGLIFEYINPSLPPTQHAQESNKKYYGYNNYLHGLLKAMLYSSVGNNTTNKDFKWNSEIMLAYAPTIYRVMEEAGLPQEDVPAMKNYLKFLITKTADYCDNDFHLVNIMPGLGSSFNGKSNGKKSDARRADERRQSQCSDMSYVMLMLGIVGRDAPGQERVEIADILYNAVKDNYKKDYGATVLSSGVASLLALNTVGGYNRIERLLTKDTVSGISAGRALMDILDLLSLNAWAQKGITAVNYVRGGGGSFLNDTAMRFQYVDEDAARKMGVSSFTVSVVKDNPSLGYNVPYRNVLQDIGIMIASAGTKEGNELTSRILKQYNAQEASRPSCLIKSAANPVTALYCSPSRFVHLPLVVGLLEATKLNAAEVNIAAKMINTLDWWDLNEATQRSVNNSVTGKNIAGVVTRDFNKAKEKRNDYNERINTMSFWADIAVSAIFLTMLIASLPAIVKNSANFLRNANRIRVIKAAGKGNLLDLTHARIKAIGVKPAQLRQQSIIAQNEKAVAQYEANKAAQLAKAKEAAAVKPMPQNGQVNLQVVTKDGVSTDLIASRTNTGVKVDVVNNNGGYLSKARQQKTGTLQPTQANQGSAATGMPFQNERVLTATVGEGGSGASANASRATWQERLAGMADDQIRAEALNSQAGHHVAYQNALRNGKGTSTFNGNWFFNKPYNQLPKWKQWAFDQYYLNLGNAFDVTVSSGKGLLRNPGKALMAGSVPFGTTAEIGTYARAAENVQMISEIGQTAQAVSTSFGTVVKTGSVATSVPGVSTMQALSSVGGLLKAPTLVAILNEPQSYGHQLSDNYGSWLLANSRAADFASTAAETAQEGIVTTEADDKNTPDQTPVLQVTPVSTENTATPKYAFLPEGWLLTNQNPVQTKLVAEVKGDKETPAPFQAQNQFSDPLVTAAFLGIPFFTKIKNFITESSLEETSVNVSPKQANKYAINVLSKQAPLNSQLVNIVKSSADDKYKEEALLKLHAQGLLKKAIDRAPESTREMLNSGDMKENLLKLYEAALLESALANIKDVNMPRQTRLSPQERENVEHTKELVNNLNEEITAGTIDWGTGVTPFETPKTNTSLIEDSKRPMDYVKSNAKQGKSTKNGVFYDDNIPVYYRDKNGNLSDHPRILLSYSKVSKFSTMLAKVGLASKKGFTIPHGLVLALDEEGKMKLVMPRGNLHVVEQNGKSKSIVLDGKESNRVAVDSELTSSDLVEIASMLQKNPDLAFEIDLNKPDSFNIFLTMHSLFIGNDAGNTLTGQFKGYAEQAGGNASVNGMGGVGYATPFIGGALMNQISKWGHVKTIMNVYVAALAALGFSIGFVGMNGFYNFPENPEWLDFVLLGLPTTVMVLGGSILNTSIQTMLNIYKDPVARSTAHLQFANNKNYSRLGVSAITGLALVSNLGLNWSVVVPLAAILVLTAGALMFNTRIYDQHKLQKAANKEEKLKQQEIKAALTAEQVQKAKADAAAKQKADKELKAKFHKIYKKELSKKREMKDISNRVSKLYASYAASLLVIVQSLKMVADKIITDTTGPALSTGLLALVAAPILFSYLAKKFTGKESHIGEELKKYAVPLAFFATTLATIYFAGDGKSLGISLTTLCLLTTTMMRAFSTELIKAKAATDDQLSGLSIPVIAAMTTALVFAPSSGMGVLASLAGVLLLYAGTAVPGQLDSARMQNFITSEYKAKKAEFEAKKDEMIANGEMTEAQYNNIMKELKDEEKYMATKGAAKFSYLNGAGILGIAFAVLGSYFLQDLTDKTDPTAWQTQMLNAISTITGNTGENNAIAFSRVVLMYASVVAWFLVAQNGPLMKAAVGLFKKQKITEENIANGKINAKSFDINANNAAIKISAMDKELKEINGIVFKNGKSSENKMTEILNKLFTINNRLKAISDVLGAESVAKSLEQLKYIAANLEGMIGNNDISFSYKQQFNKLKNALNAQEMSYLEEGLYNVPASLKNYENGIMMVRELQHLADDIVFDEDIQQDTYKRFNEYYTRAVQELTQYAQDNPIDSKRVNKQIRELYKMSQMLQEKDHEPSKVVVSEEDIVKLLQTITLFDVGEPNAK